ncbi:MAG: cell division protein ZapA [[Eubacterium] siraeum]
MEKVKISISGHDFYLKSEDPNRMYETAENLQKRIDKLSAMAASMSLTDIVMLAALDIADENYDNRNVVIKAQQLSQEDTEQNLLPAKKSRGA